MDLLHPRRAYQRAYTDDHSHTNDDRDNIELRPMRSLKTAKSDYTIDSRYEDTKSGYSNLSLSEYGNDYHFRGNDTDRLPLLRPSFKARWFSGFRAGAYGAAVLALISLLINLTAAIWLKRHPNAESSLVEVYNGSCEEVSDMDIWVHLLINAISTLLLGGSNYCMQCLCAPTRDEVDKAHFKGHFLDIGVPSYRNLSSIAWPRVIMWWLLGLSSIPLHLMYNSAFYSALSANSYKIISVTPEFLTGGNATTTTRDTTDAPPTLEIQQQIANDKNDTWQRLEPVECIKQYSKVFMNDRRNVVLVSSNTTVGMNVSTVLAIHQYDFNYAVAAARDYYDPFYWICDSDPEIASKITIPDQIGSRYPPCDTYVNRIESIADRWSPYGFPLEYCLSETVEERCSFNGNLPIVVVVIVANAVKAIIMLTVAYHLQGDPLITLGDAIESFLDAPDDTTIGVCTLSRDRAVLYATVNDYRTDDGPKWEGIEKIDSQIRQKKPATMRWSAAASGRRWTLTIGLLIGALFMVLGFMIPSILAVKNAGGNIKDLGFGTVHASAIITGWSIDNIEDPSLQILAAIFIANLPQAILSFLYLNLNGLLTSMWVAAEWSNFSKIRKTLRVSTPKTGQRSTHFLQLPYKVAGPLMFISGLLHWLISQSIFLAVVAEYSPAGALKSAVSIATCGFSPMAQIMVLCLGLALIIVSVVIGRQKYDSSMPLAGSCSAAIAAACHRPDWDIRAGTSAVQWGVLPESDTKNGIGHCCLTSGEVEPVQEGKAYAGLSTSVRRQKDSS